MLCNPFVVVRATSVAVLVTAAHQRRQFDYRL